MGFGFDLDQQPVPCDSAETQLKGDWVVPRSLSCKTLKGVQIQTLLPTQIGAEMSPSCLIHNLCRKACSPAQRPTYIQKKDLVYNSQKTQLLAYNLASRNYQIHSIKHQNWPDQNNQIILHDSLTK